MRALETGGRITEAAPCRSEPIGLGLVKLKPGSVLHAILLGAGGSLTGPGDAAFPYNKHALLNGPFLARAWKGSDPYPELLVFP